MSESSESPLTPRHRVWPKRLAVGLLTLAVFCLAFMGYIGLLDKNLHTIAEGKCYRSAQLKREGLSKAITTLGIKSVVNLRGERHDVDWYRNEIAVCQEQKIDHLDINIGLGELPKPEMMRTLVEKLEAGPYPMLLHCRSGSDRSGLAGAFYLSIVEKKPVEQAQAEQVSWRYGHFGIGRAKSIDNFFSLYRETANGKSLKDWIWQSYPALYNARTLKNARARIDD